MNTYPAMNEQIVDVLRWTDNPASLYAAARIEELEAERDALAGVLGDANELHGEVRAERDKLQKVCEALVKRVLRHMDSGERPCPLCNHHFNHNDDCPFILARAALGKPEAGAQHGAPRPIHH